MEVFGSILTYDFSNTAMLFVFVCFTRLLFLAVTKYVTKSPMKMMKTRPTWTGGGNGNLYDPSETTSELIYSNPSFHIICNSGQQNCLWRVME